MTHTIENDDDLVLADERDDGKKGLAQLAATAVGVAFVALFGMGFVLAIYWSR